SSSRQQARRGLRSRLPRLPRAVRDAQTVLPQRGRMRRLVATEPKQPNPEFARLASEDRVRTVLTALARTGVNAAVVDTGEEARRRVLDMLPDGAEVFTSTSTTLD